MEESTVVNEWIAIGEKRGEARGGVQEAQATILKPGGKRFGPASEAAETTVKTIENHDRLKRILDRLLDATSWDDLLATA